MVERAAEGVRADVLYESLSLMPGKVLTLASIITFWGSLRFSLGKGANTFKRSLKFFNILWLMNLSGKRVLKYCGGNFDLLYFL